MSKRSLSMILALCMLIPAFSGMSAYAVGEESETESSVFDPMSQVPAENAYEKIHFYFDTAEHANLESTSELAAATASVKTDYATALGVAQRRSTDADVNENVYITVQFVSDYMEDETYQTLKAARENAKTADERDEAKTNMNQYSKQYHADLVAENLPSLSAIPYTAFHAIDYSSFVTLTVPAAELDTAVLEEVADQDNILHISLTDGFEVVADSGTYAETNSSKTGWQDVLECINADDIIGKVYNGDTYTGSGIKVGVYESYYSGNNPCDLSILQIRDPGSQFHFREHNDIADSWDSITHSNMVLSILVEMLPNAEFYFAHIPNIPEIDPVTGIRNCREGVEWFIDQGCDVVNCSFGIDNNGYYRYDYDAVYDYQIYYNDIVVVKSAGNSTASSRYITSPGLAKNVITVGGIVYDEDIGWRYTDQACALNIGNSIKPNVAAPFFVYFPELKDDSGNAVCAPGTSFSAPLVTACVAIYYEFFHLKVSNYVPKSLARSVVMSSANKTANYQSQGDHYQADENVGAGIIDLELMLSLMFNFGTIQGSANSTITLSSISNVDIGTELRIALSWNADATPTPMGIQSSGSVSSPEIDLYLLDASGNVVASSMYTNSSSEYIRYTAPSSGTYSVVAVNTEQFGTPVPLALSYTKIGG